MKINRKIKIAIGSVFGTLLLLFVILVAHIAAAKPLENATIQVSRIDFNQPFDSIGAMDIKEKIRLIPGVKSDVIVKGNVVVYFHDNKIADSQKVFDELMSMGDYSAKRFVVPVHLANKQVCPVMNHNSSYYKFSQTVHHIFN